VALLYRGCVVSATLIELLHLAENPRILWRRAGQFITAVATGFAHHAGGIFGSVYIAIADYWNLNGLLDGGDDLPIGGARVTLAAGTWVDSYAFDAKALRQLGDFYRDNGLVIPTGANLSW